MVAHFGDDLFNDTRATFDASSYPILGIQSECGRIRTRKTQNTDTFHAVKVVFLHVHCDEVKVT